MANEPRPALSPSLSLSWLALVVRHALAEDGQGRWLAPAARVCTTWRDCVLEEATRAAHADEAVSATCRPSRSWPTYAARVASVKRAHRLVAVTRQAEPCPATAGIERRNCSGISGSNPAGSASLGSRAKTGAASDANRECHCDGPAERHNQEDAFCAADAGRVYGPLSMRASCLSEMWAAAPQPPSRMPPPRAPTAATAPRTAHSDTWDVTQNTTRPCRIAAWAGGEGGCPTPILVAAALASGRREACDAVLAIVLNAAKNAHHDLLRGDREEPPRLAYATSHDRAPFQALPANHPGTGAKPAGVPQSTMAAGAALWERWCQDPWRPRVFVRALAHGFLRLSSGSPPLGTRDTDSLPLEVLRRSARIAAWALAHDLVTFREACEAAVAAGRRPVLDMLLAVGKCDLSSYAARDLAARLSWVAFSCGVFRLCVGLHTGIAGQQIGSGAECVWPADVVAAMRAIESTRALCESDLSMSPPPPLSAPAVAPLAAGLLALAGMAAATHLCEEPRPNGNRASHSPLSEQAACGRCAWIDRCCSSAVGRPSAEAMAKVPWLVLVRLALAWVDRAGKCMPALWPEWFRAALAGAAQASPATVPRENAVQFVWRVLVAACGHGKEGVVRHVLRSDGAGSVWAQVLAVLLRCRVRLHRLIALAARHAVDAPRRAILGLLLAAHSQMHADSQTTHIPRGPYVGSNQPRSLALYAAAHAVWSADERAVACCAQPANSATRQAMMLPCARVIDLAVALIASGQYRYPKMVGAVAAVALCRSDFACGRTARSTPDAEVAGDTGEHADDELEPWMRFVWRIGRGLVTVAGPHSSVGGGWHTATTCSVTRTTNAGWEHAGLECVVGRVALVAISRGHLDALRSALAAFIFDGASPRPNWPTREDSAMWLRDIGQLYACLCRAARYDRPDLLEAVHGSAHLALPGVAVPSLVRVAAGAGATRIIAWLVERGYVDEADALDVACHEAARRGQLGVLRWLQAVGWPVNGRAPGATSAARPTLERVAHVTGMHRTASWLAEQRPARSLPTAGSSAAGRAPSGIRQLRQAPATAATAFSSRGLMLLAALRGDAVRVASELDRWHGLSFGSVEPAQGGQKTKT